MLSYHELPPPDGGAVDSFARLGFFFSWRRSESNLREKLNREIFCLNRHYNHHHQPLFCCCRFSSSLTSLWRKRPKKMENYFYYFFYSICSSTPAAAAAVASVLCRFFAFELKLLCAHDIIPFTFSFLPYNFFFCASGFLRLSTGTFICRTFATIRTHLHAPMHSHIWWLPVKDQP